MYRIQLLLLFLISSALVKAQQPLSLEDAIKFAMQNNTGIKNAKINIADAEARIYENRATGLPNISGTIDWQTFFLKPKVALPASFANGTSNAVFGILNAYGVKDKNGNVIPPTPPVDPNASNEPVKISFQQTHSITPGISLSQLIYSGSYNVAIRAARDYRNLVQKQLLAKETEVRNQVVDAYLPALLISESVKIFDKNIENLEKLLSETKAFNKEGFVENLDVDRLTLSLDFIKSQRANIARNKDLVVNALKFVIGAKGNENFDLVDDINSLLKAVSPEDLNGPIDFNKRSEYGLLLQGERMTALQLDLAKSYNYPTVAGFASYSYGVQGNNFNSKDNYFWLQTGVFGAKVTMPIWNGGGIKYTKERAQLAMEVTKNQRIDFENVVTMQINNARLAYTNAKLNLDNQEKNLALAEKIFTISKKKYKEGVGSSVEIIQAESTLYQNQQNLIQAKYDLLKTKMDLDKAIGNR